VTDCGFELVGGRGWTELAKEAPGFHVFFAPTPATLSNFTIIRYCTRETGTLVTERSAVPAPSVS